MHAGAGCELHRRCSVSPSTKGSLSATLWVYSNGPRSPHAVPADRSWRRAPPPRCPALDVAGHRQRRSGRQRSAVEGLFTLKGAGADIGGAADAFQFVLPTVVGRRHHHRACSERPKSILDESRRHYREALTPASPHAALFVSAAKASRCSRRTVPVGPARASGSRRGAAMDELARPEHITRFDVGQRHSWTMLACNVAMSATAFCRESPEQSQHARAAAATFDNVR